MTIDLRPNYKDVLPQLAPGKFGLFVTDERKWEIYAVSGRYDSTDVEVLIGKDDYRAPFFVHRDSLHESAEYAAYRFHVARYLLVAVFDTTEQADAAAKQMIALDAKYEEQTRAARLAYEMGLLIVVEQS